MSALVRNVQGEKSYTQNICYESTHTHLSEGELESHLLIKS